MEEGYAICFNKWALDKDIKNDLGLLLIISSLCAEKGYCFASNSFLANLFEIDEATISRKIKNLEKCGYITIEYERRGAEIINRYIRLTNISIDGLQKNQSTIDKNVKENNTTINNTNNNIKENIKRKDFVKPTLEEIKQYVSENMLNVNADDFFQYFETGNWIDSKGNKVRNWKQKLLTWNKYKNNNSSLAVKPQTQRYSFDHDYDNLEDLYDVGY